MATETSLAAGSLDTPEAHTDWQTRLGVLAGDSRHRLLLVVFLAGLVLGWMVVGRWLFPAQRNADPWELAPQHQSNLISLVAADYWHNQDAARAAQALAGWEPESLARLIAEMESQTTSVQVHQQLAALEVALGLPEYRASLLETILEEKLILLSAVFSVLPLAGAILLAVYPRLNSKKAPVAQESDQPSPEEADLLDELFVSDGANVPYGSEPAQAAQAVGSEKVDGEEIQEGSYEEEEELIGARAGEEDEEDLEGFDEDWDESTDDDLSEIGAGAVADILTSLFEEDDESLQMLETLCKGLPDISIDELQARAQQVRHRFQTERPRRS
ncbi:MAG: hypothetical protein ACOYZ7_12320 [Chloroflexota bacterium]